MMKPETLRQKLAQINVWKRGGIRAPHKPLLLLYALARCRRGAPRLIPFAEVDQKLTQLLREFGPSRKSVHPEYPFWRLQSDGIWELQNADQDEARKSNTDAKKSELLKFNVTGGLRFDVDRLVREDPDLLNELAHQLLDANFPSSLHDEILSDVGLELVPRVTKRKRDPEFRTRVLKAYGFCCAVCGFDIRLSNREVGMEAAHIMWHQAGGPDLEENGLALCVLHHRLLDYGAIGLEHPGQIKISEQVHGTKGLNEWLLCFHGKSLRQPVNDAYRPKGAFIKWHTREVFRQPARQ